MDKQTFEDRLRENIRREPFIPYVVERNDGETIIIGHQGLVFCDGFASYLTPSHEFIEFNCEDVRQIRLVKEEETKT